MHSYGETTKHSILEALERAANFTMESIGLGPHGLLRSVARMLSHDEVHNLLRDADVLIFPQASFERLVNDASDGDNTAHTTQLPMDDC